MLKIKVQLHAIVCVKKGGAPYEAVQGTLCSLILQPPRFISFFIRETCSHWKRPAGGTEGTPSFLKIGCTVWSSWLPEVEECILWRLIQFVPSPPSVTWCCVSVDCNVWLHCAHNAVVCVCVIYWTVCFRWVLNSQTWLLGFNVPVGLLAKRATSLHVQVQISLHVIWFSIIWLIANL